MKLPNLRKDSSLSEKVYQHLCKALVAGKLHPGERITESELARKMGISRAPIREALKRLAKDHLVVLVPRSGCYVSDLTEKEVQEIYEIRLRLECMALEFAFDRLQSYPKHLVQLLEQFNGCISKEDGELIESEVRLDTRLHDIIAKQSDCPNLQEMLENLTTRLEIFRLQTTTTTMRAGEALKEHISIVQAILDGNRGLSVKYLAEHIEHTKSNVLSNIRTGRDVG